MPCSLLELCSLASLKLSGNAISLSFMLQQPEVEIFRVSVECVRVKYHMVCDFLK